MDSPKPHNSPERARITEEKEMVELRLAYETHLPELLHVLRSLDRFRPQDLPGAGRNLQASRHLLETAYALLDNDYRELQGDKHKHSLLKEIGALQNVIERLKLGLRPPG